MIANNVLVWSAQIAALAATAGIAGTVLRLRAPKARLFYWQVVLAACLALPLARPWRQEFIDAEVSVSIVILSQGPKAAGHHAIRPGEAVLWLLAAGIAARLLWLGAGFWRLHRYRRCSTLWGTREGASLLLAEGVRSPVTFGAMRPVVLLPAQFPDFEPRVQEAVLRHELLHVRRHDWAFMVGEELVRAAFWFHPAVWWVLGEIGLAREQEVDRLVVEGTRAREEYVDALLTIAGAGSQLDLAPAPLFLRKRHLKQRVVSILREVRMSKTRLISSLAAALAVVAAAGWMITAALPLSAAPQADSAGVTVEVGGARIMHRTPVLYPEGAREQGVQGTVVLQAIVDATGTVTDAQVLSGPEELRRPALASVLNWHFSPEAGNTRQVSITFQPGYAKAPVSAGASGIPAKEQPSAILKTITIVGLSDQAQTDLLARLPIHEGATMGPRELMEVNQVVKEFDSHLNVIQGRAINGETTLTIATSDLIPARASGRIRVGGNVQALKLANQPRPQYPLEAKQQHIQGVVKLFAVIGKDGTVQNLNVISGDPILAASALQAARQWVYQPTLLNGSPVEVETEIDVNYTLSQ
ncbi:MAG: M56 family metallopeptidase [Acidobacteriia bacterium]|nr:M56 family metallopeptidase [Terriglobia bacterium]